MRYDYMVLDDWICFGVLLLGTGILIWGGIIYPLILLNKPGSKYNPRDDDGYKTALGYVWSQRYGKWIRKNPRGRTH
jgi:hypothetical protein